MLQDHVSGNIIQRIDCLHRKVIQSYFGPHERQHNNNFLGPFRAIRNWNTTNKAD
jgi:hypothetical protein